MQDVERYQLIARAIAAAANQLLPDGFAVREAGGDLCIGDLTGAGPSWFGVAARFRNWSEEVTSNAVASQAEGFLDYLQDIVCVCTRTVWPPAEMLPWGAAPARRAEVVGSTLRLWFEFDGQPVTPVAEASLDW